MGSHSPSNSIRTSVENGEPSSSFSQATRSEPAQRMALTHSHRSPMGSQLPLSNKNRHQRNPSKNEGTANGNTLGDWLAKE